MGTPSKIRLDDAIFVPTCSKNLVSVKKMIDKGAHIEFEKNPGLTAWDNTNFPFRVTNNLYYLPATALQGNSRHQVESDKYAMVATDMALWHQRLEHNNKADIQVLQMQAHGIRVTKESKSITCESCETQKARKVPIPNKWGTRANHEMEVVHTDILGPVEATTLG